MLHRLSYILLICFLAGSASGQYPATGNKSRLGWQTTADGLVWRGAIADTATIDPVGLLQAWALVDTASGVLYQYRGKAWRPVLAYAIQPFDSIVFNNNEGDADSAELKYNADIGSLVYGANDGAQIPVLPGHWYVRNDTSVTLTKGTLVRAVGTIGASGRIKVRHMIGDNSISAEYVMGIVVKDIPAGDDGYIMFYGKIRKLNTNAWNEGDLLYPDDFTPGALTNGPVYFKTPIAFVVHKSINQGVIAVRIQTENYLSRLHDVTLPGLAAQNILRYSGQYWIPGRDTSVYDFDARLKGNRTVLMNNFDIKFRNQYSENNYVQIRPTFVMVMDSTTGEQATLNKYGIAGPVTGGYLSEVRLANGVYLNGSNSRFVEGLDTGDGYDVTIDTVGRVRFRVSATGTADSLYGKTSSGLLTAIKPNYLAYTDTASMLSTYLRPSEILAGTGITLVKDSTVTISAPTTLSSSTAIIDVAEVFVDNLTALRLPWDGTAVVGVIKTGLYLTSGVNEAFVQHELIPNGDKGDITTSAGGAGMTIDAGAVTNSKANFTTLTAPADTAAQLLGVTTDGRPNTVGLAGGLTLTGGFLTVTGLAGGTVTSVQGEGGIITDPAPGITAAGKVRADTAGVLASKVWANNALALKLNAADTASLSSRIDAKQNTITGAATSITTANLAASRALVSDSGGKVAESAVTATELGYLSGVTSAIQTQLNGKQNTLTNPITGTGTANQIAFFNGTTSLSSLTTATYPNLTELSYVKGVTSAIQTQLNGKQNTLTNPVTGTGTANELPFWNGTNAIGTLTTSTYPNLTELSYVKGVTSAIQTQLNGKQNTLTNPVTGTGTANELPFWNGTNAIGTLTTATYPNLTELSYVKGVTSAIQTQLDGKLSSAAGAVGETNLANGSVTGAKLGSMTSANLSGALTDETGSGAVVFATSPTMSGVKINGAGSFGGSLRLNYTGAGFSTGMLTFSARDTAKWSLTTLTTSDDITFYNASTATFPFTILSSNGNIGFSTLDPSRTLDVNGQARIRNLTTDTPTRIVGADADGDLGEVTIGTGLTISGGALQLQNTTFATVTGATYTVANGVKYIICNRAGTITITLPTASTWSGREIMVKTIQAQTVISAASNVAPIDDTAAGTAILPATDGAWALLVSDGTNWIIMQKGQ